MFYERGKPEKFFCYTWFQLEQAFIKDDLDIADNTGGDNSSQSMASQLKATIYNRPHLNLYFLLQ